MAMEAYLGSQEVGAGAAQGDLGFFMLLTIVSPIIVLSTAFLWWLAGRAAKATKVTEKQSALVRSLTVTNVLALGWNWFYLYAFWKA